MPRKQPTAYDLKTAALYQRASELFREEARKQAARRRARRTRKGA